ncbi:hypothetical protein SAMN05421771_2959 [Granulicella pectinivorans]|uniref:Uncharacterized protein n=1 Tax=Granulicella pectinivorans TaxID=474950 RepID=A0A1I6MM29_9BACT|nr:hypothetical protein [Granulicella pectinivorans]SFS16719.1 hypothetical protein SAMN05421771_2959 [Granulicella pectinivorans]
MRALKVAGSLAVFVALILSGRSASGQNAPRDAVRVTCSCEDAVGKAYADALRNALTGSKHFRVMAVGELLDQEPISINIVSLPIGDGPNGQPRTVISVVSMRGGAMTHQLIETCNKIEIESSAQAKLLELVNWK